MKRKIISIIIIVIAATAVFNLFIKEEGPDRTPDYEINLELGERFISSILTLDAEGHLYAGVSLGYPRAEIRKFTARGELQKNIPLRTQEGDLVARRAAGQQTEVISRGLDYQGWQGILEVNEQGEIILFDPATQKLFLLSPEGILQKQFVLDSGQEDELGSFSVQRHSMLRGKLYLGLSDTRPETAGDRLQTLTVDITAQTHTHSAVPVGYTDQRGEIYYTTRESEPGLFSSTKIILNVYNYRDGQHSAEYELPLSWSANEWRRDLWAFNPAEQAVYYMDWKNWLGRRDSTFRITRYCLQTRESTTWATIEQHQANINTLALKIKQGVLYLVMDRAVYLYDI